jgi:hypothetical protein
LQYFFMSDLDMVELLAFCCAMQSLICCFFVSPADEVVLEDEEDSDWDLGYWDCELG